MKKFLPLAAVFIAGCTSEGDATINDSTRAIQCGEAPFLDDEPVWSFTAPAVGFNCFGTAVALGDFDGDGQRDLAVGERGCSSRSTEPGRIALFAGTAGRFADTPTWTMLSWSTAGAPRFLELAAGDIDGDGHDDLVAGSRLGTQVFTGITDLAAPLGAPSFRAPGTIFSAPGLVDVDGDGRANLISVSDGSATVWRAGFVPARVLEAEDPRDGGDADGDGAHELLVASPGGFGSSLYRGCAPGTSGCDGGLSSEPLWTMPRIAAAVLPDQNGDGLAEVFVREAGFGGRLWLYESAAGGIADTPTWTMLGDPNYFGFGADVVLTGDLDKDRRTRDFVVTAAGRIYGFFPRWTVTSDLVAKFAWPRPDALQAQILDHEPFNLSTPVVAAAGDLDGDRYADLVAAQRLFDGVTSGRVVVFSGGKLLPPGLDEPPPYLMGAPACGAEGDKPDLTVDVGTIERSLYLEERSFDAEECEVAEGCVAAPGDRRLLRFSAAVGNLGAAPLIIPGPDTAPELYHFDECHLHYHLEDFASYRLLDAAGGTVAAGRKQGYLLADVVPLCADAAEPTSYDPDLGVSPGWADVYPANIACQWIDITGVPDGDYTLEVAVDTAGIVDQDDIMPDTVTVPVRLTADRVELLP